MKVNTFCLFFAQYVQSDQSYSSMSHDIAEQYKCYTKVYKRNIFCNSCFVHKCHKMAMNIV